MAPPAQNGVSEQQVHANVQHYYGEVLAASTDMKTSACTAAGAPHPLVRAALQRVPPEVQARYFGCGSAFPLGIEGLRVLDLGCGSGRDCYVCAAMVGEAGSVTGVDMTDAQLELANRHAQDYCCHTLGYKQPNMRFVKGQIERLGEAGIQAGSVDLIISNCVVNLTPDKQAVLAEAYRVLAPGGEMYFSDMYCTRRVPEELRTNEVLWDEGLAGSLYTQDFLRICRQVGFLDPRQLASHPIQVHDPELRALVGPASYLSITYRLFKLPGTLEAGSEDYGQAARYLGTIPGSPHAYSLDSQHTFPTHKWVAVCGNTAAMLGDSWLGKHFEVAGDRSTHFGAFPAGSGSACTQQQPAGSCC